MRTLGSINHASLDEVPIAILLRGQPETALVGNDPIDQRPGSGGRLGRAIPHGTRCNLTARA